MEAPLLQQECLLGGAGELRAKPYDVIDERRIIKSRAKSV